MVLSASQIMLSPKTSWAAKYEILFNMIEFFVWFVVEPFAVLARFYGLLKHPTNVENRESDLEKSEVLENSVVEEKPKRNVFGPQERDLPCRKFQEKLLEPKNPILSDVLAGGEHLNCTEGQEKHGNSGKEKRTHKFGPHERLTSQHLEFEKFARTERQYQLFASSYLLGAGEHPMATEARRQAGEKHSHARNSANFSPKRIKLRRRSSSLPVIERDYHRLGHSSSSSLVSEEDLDMVGEIGRNLCNCQRHKQSSLHSNSFCCAADGVFSEPNGALLEDLCVNDSQEYNAQNMSFTGPSKLSLEDLAPLDAHHSNAAINIAESELRVQGSGVDASIGESRKPLVSFSPHPLTKGERRAQCFVSKIPVPSPKKYCCQSDSEQTQPCLEPRRRVYKKKVEHKNRNAAIRAELTFLFDRKFRVFAIMIKKQARGRGFTISSRAHEVWLKQAGCIPDRSVARFVNYTYRQVAGAKAALTIGEYKILLRMMCRMTGADYWELLKKMTTCSPPNKDTD